ncbi:hypothetical protein [Kaarinaea lacus]
MTRKIAILVRDRQEEALRMSIGLTLMDDSIDVYVLDKKVNPSENNALNIETIKEMGMKLYSNCEENTEMEFLSTKEIGQKIPSYDHVLAY